MRTITPHTTDRSRPRHGLHRAAWGLLLAGLVGIVLAYAGAARGHGTWSAPLLAMTMPIATLGVTLLGFGRRAPVWVVVVVSAVHLLLALVLTLAVVATDGPGTTGTWLSGTWVAGTWHGVPMTTVLVVMAAGAVPVVLLPLVYTVSFRQAQLSDGDVERVRAARLPT